MDQFGTVEPIDRLGQRVVIAVAFAGDRRLDARLRESLAVANRNKAGLSQEALALRAGVACTFVGLIKMGERQPSLSVIFANSVLIKHPQATFLIRVAGSSMRDAGVDDGDVVLVDRALRPKHGSNHHRRRGR